MRGKRIMNYRGHVIWWYEGSYMVALKHDGTDDYFRSLEDAMTAIDEIEDRKEKGYA